MDGPGTGAGTASSGTGGNTSSGTATGTGTGTGTGSSSSGTGGCAAVPDTSAVGESCENAIPLGVLSDVGADLVTVSGNGVHSGGAVWWSFEGADDLDTAGDEYHVDVRFLSNPGSAYVMDVYRGTCASEDRLAGGEPESVDWFTNFATTDVGCSGPAPCGEGDCVPPPGGVGVNSCDDDTATYFVRIGPANGVGSCDTFELEMSNGVH